MDAANADKLYAAEREKDVLRDLFIDQQLLLEKGKDLGINGDTDLIKREDQMRKEMKLDSIEDLEKEATKQGISWEDFKQNMRNQIITQRVIGEEVGQKLALNKDEEQVAEVFKGHAQSRDGAAGIHPPQRNSDYPENSNSSSRRASRSQRRRRTIRSARRTIPPPSPAAEAKANEILKQLRDGGKFEELAKKSSDGPSAADGGALGMFKRGQLAKELEDRTFAMKSGEITDVIRVKQGYAILRVDEHQMAGIPPMKDVLPKIQDALYYEKLQPALRAYLTKLREDAYIKYAEGYVDTGASPQPDCAD